MRSMAGGARQFKRLLEKESSVGVLNPAWVSRAVTTSSHRGRRCYWTPLLTITTFLRQVLLGNCSCREAVALTLFGDMARHADGEEHRHMSGDPSAYVQARSRLPLALFTHLSREISNAASRSVGDIRRWCGHRIVVADGSTIIMPDEPSLQRAFPQTSVQKPGCGFPMARLTALFCWASGTLIELAVDTIRVHELTLLRRMLQQLQAGDVLLGDRIFCSYVDIALLRAQKVDSVTRLHVSRCNDMRKGLRLGKNDRLVEWRRATKCPTNLSRERWNAIPRTMTMRHVRYDSNTPGFRSRRIELATTLLDSNAYPAEELARLYHDRWRVELNLRDLKATLGMDQLHTRSVDMIRKEVAMYGIAYNLVRRLMWQSGVRYKTDPYCLSFAGTVQRLCAALPYLTTCDNAERRSALYIQLLTYIGYDLLPERPPRLEPRRIKRRHNAYLYFNRSRIDYKNYLLKNTA